jgi:uncharacterized SAM-binding protein YcdF (DUF218 family)
MPQTSASPTQRKTLKIRLALGVIALPMLALSAAIYWIDAFGHREQVQSAQAIVVLGAGVLPNGQASSSLRERTAHAVALYHRGLAPFIIFTGGIGTYPPSEAQVASNLAIKMKVPRDKVLLEDQSTSTRENAQFAAEICRTRGWKKVIVVSQPFHLWRAQRDFKRFGLIVYTSPVRNANIDTKPLQRVLWTAREVLLSLRDATGL